MSAIEIADTVHHKPSGEHWIVARVSETHVWPAGWPPCRASIEDCELEEKASDVKREAFMRELRGLPASDERHLPTDQPQPARSE